MGSTWAHGRSQLTKTRPISPPLFKEAVAKPPLNSLSILESSSQDLIQNTKPLPILITWAKWIKPIMIALSQGILISYHSRVTIALNMLKCWRLSETLVLHKWPLLGQSTEETSETKKLNSSIIWCLPNPLPLMLSTGKLTLLLESKLIYDLGFFQCNRLTLPL